MVLTPVTPTSASIGLATISRDGTTFPARAYSTVYEATGQARKPSITFPLEAKELFNDPDSVLRISQVRQVVRFEIPLSLCEQKIDCNAAP